MKYAPNFNEIRNRYQDRIPEIIKSMKSGKFQIEDKAVILQVNNREERFDASIILTTYQAKDGQPVASNHGVVVSLDLNITDELKAEGFARDIVRNIQDARKQIGSEIMDVIVISFEGAVPEQWIDYICKETLGQLGDIKMPDSIIEIESEDSKKVKIYISKVS